MQSILTYFKRVFGPPDLRTFLLSERDNGVNVPETYFIRVIKTGPNNESKGHPSSYMGDFKKIIYYLDVQALPIDVKNHMFAKRFKLLDKLYGQADIKNSPLACSISPFEPVEYETPSKVPVSLRALYIDTSNRDSDALLVTPDTWKLYHNFAEQAAYFHYYTQSAKVNVLVTHYGWEKLGLFRDAKSIMYKDLKKAGHDNAWIICSYTHDVSKFPGAIYYAGPTNPESSSYKFKKWQCDDDSSWVYETVDPTGLYHRSRGYRFPIEL